MNTGTKKYKRINKEQILELLKERKVVSIALITKEYNCSAYLAERLIDELKDDGKVTRTKFGYKL